MIVWLMPTTMVARAIGSWTFVSRCQRVCPERVGRLDRGRRDVADAVGGDPDDRRQRVDQGADDRGGGADAEEQDDGSR